VTATAGRRRAVLDPDRLAALEEERDFLARSLEDLERELAAGELDPADYAVLRDDYVTRTAAVLRALQERRAVLDDAPRPPWPRRVAVAAGVALFALAAGVLVAQVAGTRTSGDSLTGDIRQSNRQRLASCLELAGSAFAVGGAETAGGQGDLLGAVQCYSEVLRDEPSNAEALTYRGWLLVRTGDQRLEARAAADLDAAVAADPTFPDARAFRAVVFYRLGRFEAAQAELDVLDALDAAPIIDTLLDQLGVRDGVAAGLAGDGNGAGDGAGPTTPSTSTP
jgi:tetratricopeptide (TPR) repeat protein